MARPIKAIKKNVQIKVCYTQIEIKVIKNYAQRSGLRVAEFVHDKSLNHKVKSILTPEEIEICLQLSGIANNLNQLTRHFHSGQPRHNELVGLITRINELFDKLK